jgi:hypothetical protein
MMEAYSQDKTKVDWNQEFMKIRFTRPYLVYKVRKVWVIIDKCSQLVFVIISLMIMILATHWQISLAMAIHLTCFVGLCLRVATKLYQNRKKMKSKNMEKDEEGQGGRRDGARKKEKRRQEEEGGRRQRRSWFRRWSWRWQ